MLQGSDVTPCLAFASSSVHVPRQAGPHRWQAACGACRHAVSCVMALKTALWLWAAVWMVLPQLLLLTAGMCLALDKMLRSIRQRLSCASCCRQALKAYPTSIDGDLALLRDAEPGSRQHKAVAVSPALTAVCAVHPAGRLLSPWRCRAGLF